jgi:uncharacterized protein YjbI with pentapeptide repeats
MVVGGMKGIASNSSHRNCKIGQFHSLERHGKGKTNTEVFLHIPLHKTGRSPSPVQYTTKQDIISKCTFIPMKQPPTEIVTAIAAGRDLSSLDWVGIDVSHVDLYQINLSRVNLQRANFRGAILTNALLDGADLRGADFSGADLRGTDLRGADLRGTNLQKAYLCRADLRGANLTDADLTDAKLQVARYDRTTQWSTGFAYPKSGAVGPGAQLHGAYLNSANLRHADLQGASFLGAYLSGADLRLARLNNTQLDYADFRSADLTDVELDNLQSITGADFFEVEGLDESTRANLCHRSDRELDTWNPLTRRTTRDSLTIRYV